MASRETLPSLAKSLKDLGEAHHGLDKVFFNKNTFDILLSFALQ